MTAKEVAWRRPIDCIILHEKRRDIISHRPPDRQSTKTEWKTDRCKDRLTDRHPDQERGTDQ